MTWVITPWGIVVSYLVAGLVVLPLMWWALLTPRRRAEREAERWQHAQACRRRGHR